MNQKSHRSSHFAPAFLFLPKGRRRALELLYGVCRVLDDAVDGGMAEPEAFLNKWERVFTDKSCQVWEEGPQRELARDFLNASQEYRIPLSALLDFIKKGVRVDLAVRPFQTPMETEAYCYGVAGTVGLACLPIFGVPVEDGKDFAIRLGIAVQWTNILRDVGVDAKMGRVYLPLDHLEQFGYTAEDLLRAKNSSPFHPLFEYEFKVAESHFKRAEELLPPKWMAELKPARMMGSIYRELLQKIKNRKFPVIEEKIRLNLWEKTRAVLKTKG